MFFLLLSFCRCMVILHPLGSMGFMESEGREETRTTFRYRSWESGLDGTKSMDLFSPIPTPRSDVYVRFVCERSLRPTILGSLFPRIPFGSRKEIRRPKDGEGKQPKVSGRWILVRIQNACVGVPFHQDIRTRGGRCSCVRDVEETGRTIE